MKFICDNCGEVKPNRIGYSFPATGWCPICENQLTEIDESLTEIDESLNVLSEKEAKEKRPGFNGVASR